VVLAFLTNNDPQRDPTILVKQLVGFDKIFLTVGETTTAALQTSVLALFQYRQTLQDRISIIWKLVGSDGIIIPLSVKEIRREEEVGVKIMPLGCQ
jgi:hypothetical protein